MAVSFQNGVFQRAVSGMLVFCTWVTLGMKPQRSTSARFISLRAPMTSAPMIAKRISAYIASAVRRVNIHIAISKLRPRFARGRVLGLVVAMLASCRAERCPEDDKHGNR